MTIFRAMTVKTEVMTNHAAGHAAEVTAAEYLKKRGFEIIELNWKTRFCEIDIVAKKDGAMYFVEVKSRQNRSHGFGLEYITPAKLRKMRFAAEMWVGNHEWQGEYQLAAVGIDENEITFIDEL